MDDRQKSQFSNEKGYEPDRNFRYIDERSILQIMDDWIAAEECTSIPEFLEETNLKNVITEKNIEDILSGRKTIGINMSRVLGLHRPDQSSAYIMRPDVSMKRPSILPGFFGFQKKAKTARMRPDPKVIDGVPVEPVEIPPNVLQSYRMQFLTKMQDLAARQTENDTQAGAEWDASMEQLQESIVTTIVKFSARAKKEAASSEEILEGLRYRYSIRPEETIQFVHQLLEAGNIHVDHEELDHFMKSITFPDLAPPGAQAIRFCRLMQGMTQPQMAEELGVSQVVFSGWERGRTRPNNALIKLFAEIAQLSEQESEILGRLVRPTIDTVELATAQEENRWRRLFVDMFRKSGKTRREASTELGIPERRLRGWLSGAETPPTSMLGEIVAVLKPPIEDAIAFIVSIRSDIIKHTGKEWLRTELKNIDANKGKTISYPSLSDIWIREQPIEDRAGHIIHDARVMGGSSIQQLAEKVGVSRFSIRNWENGNNSVDTVYWEPLVNALYSSNLPPEWNYAEMLEAAMKVYYDMAMERRRYLSSSHNRPQGNPSSDDTQRIAEAAYEAADEFGQKLPPMIGEPDGKRSKKDTRPFC